MMADSPHFYEPRSGHRLAHDPFSAIIGPRPIGWISSRSANGTLNLAPYSFFNAFNYSPPIIGFASVGRKDTLANVESTREFVWNLATRNLAEAMNQSSASVPPEVDEFVLSGLTPVPSRIVGPPRVGESPVAMECRVTQVIQLQNASGLAISTWLILGEVVGVHIAHSVLKDGVYDIGNAGHILRAGGMDDYFQIEPENLFKMIRPK